ncbi:3-hydroxyacyl-[acyl-carrier-protein] dehydratase FabZ [Chryseobacterium lactis]|uniref:3-hydroxyacyl-ACP dehydratase FabZ n=1 Tax=Chryseobacterium lactis TaxID=1241981 RepID=A0A3G6RMW0_CHRLC|nr:3-hydroxyacyl-ACP dehydratase FabZ [Chryseobacterium lactis]AZA83931.1 3-hydroxyacyl-ACP dehydratase FabZ [Chryseobacterium lactis]AZB04317.1 3-hydroxyacyl-ACP dehydratase FabZ [Chryseobacterium lactis]PNW12771.1 3-hydroxyacyl-[acyl-carrier-protein] dehydratase FabZ [Chryseobacterium lactis]
MPTILESYQITQILQYRYPFLLIDRVTEYVKDDSLKAVKAVSAGEPYFAGHFPNFPIMPGVLITEALAQASSLMMVLNNLDWKPSDPIPSFHTTTIGVLGNVQISFLKSVLPGSLLELDVKLDWRKGSASSVNVKASVEGSVCAKGKITVMSVDQNTIFS